MKVPMIAFVAMLGATGPGFGADLARPEAPAATAVAPLGNTALQITPYFWAANLDGRMSPFRRAPTIDIEQSFSDTLEDLEFGGFLSLWGRVDRLVVSGDLMYVSTRKDRSLGTPPLAFPIPTGTPVDVGIDSKQLTATLQAGYRVLEGESATLDLLAGARYWHLDNDVRVAAFGYSLGYGESFDWLDPIIGARGFVGMTDRISFQAQADVGGFGAGSEFTWSVLATANYVLTEHLSLSAGYKVLDVDYEKDGHVFDARLQGPVVGMTYRF